MRVKKKFLIAVASLVSMLTLSVIAIVAIFAAMNNSVQSGLTVRYNAVDVSATVRANYIIDSTRIPMVTETGEEEIVFRPTTETNASFSPPSSEDIELTSSSDFVVFEYIFTNDSNSIDVGIWLDTTAFTVTNMDISFAYSYNRIANTSTMPTSKYFNPMMIMGEAKENGHYETLYVYVKVKVSNLANDAFFEGNMDFSLEKSNPVKLNFENVSGAKNEVLLQDCYVPENTYFYHEDLPTPEFSNGRNYQWFRDASGNELVDISYDSYYVNELTFYALESPYSYYWSMGANYDILTLENKSDDKIYISESSDDEFWMGGPENELNSVAFEDYYFILNQDQKVSISQKAYQNMDGVYTTSKPSDLDAKLFYSAYGEYPQTYVGNDLNAELKKAKLKSTGKLYTIYCSYPINAYVEFEEYLYKDKKYVKCENVTENMDYNYYYEIPFSTGEEVVTGETYFFEVEPILTRAMQKNANGTYTMQSTKMLFSSPYQSSNQTNVWENSVLRDYMNDTFLNDAELLGDVVETEVLNNVEGNNRDGSGASTMDNIWIASLEEFLNWGGYEYDDAKLNMGNVYNEYTTYSGTYFPYRDYSDFRLALPNLTIYNGGTYCVFRTANTNWPGTSVWHYSYELGLSTLSTLSNYSVHPVFAVNV